MHGEINRHVVAGSAIYSDAFMSYVGLKQQGFAHQIIDHAEKYVDGQVHTNGLENFWSLVKRGLKGTYISVEPFHLFRYLDEQATVTIIASWRTTARDLNWLCRRSRGRG